MAPGRYPPHTELTAIQSFYDVECQASVAFPFPHGDEQRRNEKKAEREILVLRSTYSVVLHRAMWSEDVHGFFLTLVWSTHLSACSPLQEQIRCSGSTSAPSLRGCEGYSRPVVIAKSPNSTTPGHRSMNSARYPRVPGQCSIEQLRADELTLISIIQFALPQVLCILSRPTPSWRLFAAVFQLLPHPADDQRHPWKAIKESNSFSD